MTKIFATQDAFFFGIELLDRIYELSKWSDGDNIKVRLYLNVCDTNIPNSEVKNLIYMPDEAPSRGW